VEQHKGGHGVQSMPVRFYLLDLSPYLFEYEPPFPLLEQRNSRKNSIPQMINNNQRRNLNHLFGKVRTIKLLTLHAASKQSQLIQHPLHAKQFTKIYEIS
jgi:hypothetical protein